MFFRALKVNSPEYLRELFTVYAPSRALRSANKNQLIVPKTRLKTYGDRALSSAGAREWNALPIYIRQIDDLHTFKGVLKHIVLGSASCDQFLLLLFISAKLVLWTIPINTFVLINFILISYYNKFYNIYLFIIK